MKIIPAVLAAAAIILTGCTSAPAAAPTVTVTAPQAAPAPANPVEPDTDTFDSPSNDDDMFLMLLRNEDPVFTGIDDQTLIDLGQTTCDAFDAGMTLRMYAEVAANSGITRDEAATIAAASIVVYCPWHEGIAG